MCHVWAMTNHGERGHGVWFWKKMSEIGYPKGHVLASGQKDKWSTMEEHDFIPGEIVAFTHKKKRFEGTILRINRKSITVMTKKGTWRVSACLLKRI